MILPSSFGGSIIVSNCISEMSPNLKRTSLAESWLSVMMLVRVSYVSSVLVISTNVYITAQRVEMSDL